MGYLRSGESTESTTLGATWTSSTISLDIGRTLLIQATIASNIDAVGTIAVDGSNDGANWYVIPFTDSAGTVSTTFAVTAGVNTTEPFSCEKFAHYRVRYTRTSGGAAATLTLAINRPR